MSFSKRDLLADANFEQPQVAVQTQNKDDPNDQVALFDSDSDLSENEMEELTFANKNSSESQYFIQDKIEHPELNIVKDSSMDSLVELLQKKKFKNIIVMTGAGVSTSLGIPDFRSPDTGIYHNLGQFDLPNPEDMFDIDYFLYHPQPFYTLVKDLYPGKIQPSKTHYFIRLLADKGLLLRHYTQNIDTLERLAGIPDNLLVESHGSFHTAHCVGIRNKSGCHKEYPIESIKEKILAREVPYCKNCGGIIKPDVIFFGEELPQRFFDLYLEDFQKCDLLLVFGTSLKVQPFCNLIDFAKIDTPRCLINNRLAGVTGHPRKGFDFSGTFQKYRRDVFYKGNCDDGSAILAKCMGFEDELNELIASEAKNFKDSDNTKQ
jgi:NAD-dependent deacetylase sirtuin 2